MNNVTEMPGLFTMKEFTQMDGGKWWLTEKVLSDPLLCRRLVRTQIEELLALLAHYPLREFDEVARALHRLREAFSDVEPFDHPLLAELDAPEDNDAV